jgi:hypothetical protein
MYDFAIIVPCHLSERYLERIYDFRNYGLLNIKKTKIKVFLLTGSSSVPEDLRSGWPCDIEFVSSKSFFDGPKVYDFILNLTSEDVKKYRWWLKVDDDSVTDISSQIKRMDEEFDWTRPEYVFGDYGVTTERVFEEAIKKTKHKDRFFHPTTDGIQIFHHEFESCAISSPCMQKIIEDEECRLFLKILVLPENDFRQCYHDQGLAVAARFVKVHGSTSFFMTRHPLIDNFSLFGGRFSHIHWLHRYAKEWPIFIEKLKKLNENNNKL